MKITRILLSVILPLIQAFFFIAAIHYPNLFFIFIAVSIIATDIGIALFIPKKTAKEVVFYITLPSVALLVSSAGVLIFIEGTILSIILICFQSTLQLLYFINIYFYFSKTQKYQKRLFAHTTQALNTVNVYFCMAILFALLYFLDIKFWHLSILFVCLPLLFFSGTHLAYGIRFSLFKSSLFILACIFLEISVTLHWLSFMWFSAPLLSTLFYMTIENFSVAWHLQEITRSKILFHFILLATVVLLVMLSSPF